MTESKDARRDRFFSELCSRAGAHRMRGSAWPAVERRLPGGESAAAGGFLAARPLLAPSFAALLALGVFLWAYPGFAAEAVARIRRMFSGTFEFQVGDSKPVVKKMTVENGKPSSVEIADTRITFTLSEAQENAVKVSLQVTEKAKDGTTKVLAKPSVIARKGAPTEVTVSYADSGKPRFRVKVAPTDAAGKASVSVSEVVGKK